MSDHDHHEDGVSRRRVLECMTWAGTGVLWTITGGVPRSLGMVGLGAGRRARRHDLPADQRQPCRLRQAGQSECDRHAGRSHQQDQRDADKAVVHDPHRRHHPSVEGKEFDDADRIISQAKLDVHYVPGEHDIIDEEVKLYKERYGRGTKGAGWYSLRRRRRAFRRPRQCRRTSRAAASAISATSSSNGWRTT